MKEFILPLVTGSTSSYFSVSFMQRVRRLMGFANPSSKKKTLKLSLICGEGILLPATEAYTSRFAP
jgi:hypothetical protein